MAGISGSNALACTVALADMVVPTGTDSTAAPVYMVAPAGTDSTAATVYMAVPACTMGKVDTAGMAGTVVPVDKAASPFPANRASRLEP